MGFKGIDFPGLNIRSLKKNRGLVPLLVALAGGAALAGSYVLRLATRNPDVCWDRKNNSSPWQKLGTNGQYKFYSTFDYKALKKPEGRPDM